MFTGKRNLYGFIFFASTKESKTGSSSRAAEAAAQEDRGHERDNAQDDDRAANADRKCLVIDAANFPAQDVAGEADEQRYRDRVPEHLPKIVRQVRGSGGGDDQ